MHHLPYALPSKGWHRLSCTEQRWRACHGTLLLSGLLLSSNARHSLVEGLAMRCAFCGGGLGLISYRKGKLRFCRKANREAGCEDEDGSPSSPEARLQAREARLQKNTAHLVWASFDVNRMSNFSAYPLNILILLAVPARLERATFGLGNRCSIRLSYGTRSLARYVADEGAICNARAPRRCRVRVKHYCRPSQGGP
jgi:hypothetical protein